MTNYVFNWDPREQPSGSIVVPFKNSAELTRRCVDMVRRNTDYPRFEIVLVNNSSMPRETEDLRLEARPCPTSACSTCPKRSTIRG